MRFYTSLRIRSRASADSGSQVTGELEETSAVVDRCPVLLPAALWLRIFIHVVQKRRTLFLANREHSRVKKDTSLKNHSKKFEHLARSDFAEIKKSHFRTPSKPYKSRSAISTSLPSFSSLSALLLSLLVRCEIKLSHARNSRTRLFFQSPLIGRFMDFLSRTDFFSERILDRAEKMNGQTCQNIVDSSAYCRAIFRRYGSHKGIPQEGVLSLGHRFGCRRSGIGTDPEAGR